MTTGVFCEVKIFRGGGLCRMWGILDWLIGYELVCDILVVFRVREFGEVILNTVFFVFKVDLRVLWFVCF